MRAGPLLVERGEQWGVGEVRDGALQALGGPPGCGPAGWRVGLATAPGEGALWGGWGQGDKCGPCHTEWEAPVEHPVESPER